MKHGQQLLSEEDVRTRVITTWLAGHGFTTESISVELSFELRLGRNVYRVGDNSPHSSIFRPRADVLVRSSDGRNLMIIEVKAPSERLDDDVKEQGISYARLLKNGGIAPFVVVTNGHDTQIYDSITGELMNDACVPTNHPHIQNGFRVSIDDIALRAEALETFVSLSSDNLLAFCRAQVKQRMRALRSDDPFSGKKYIPALYIEREDANKRLHQLLDEKDNQVVILVGAPQVGKTNFVCHKVEERLKDGQPCLFYPAIGMEGNLLVEIGEDFGWLLHGSISPPQIIERLIRILQKTNQKLLFFIDGLNEASYDLARAIDRCAERLKNDKIKIVVSFTGTASRRILIDSAGNPSHIAESASITRNSVDLLEIKPEKLSKKCSYIAIKEYTAEEIENAYSIYSKVYNTQFSSTHERIKEPFLLRIAMEIYQGEWLPEVLDEPLFIEKIILLKASRAVDLNEETATLMLSNLAEEMLIHGAPISQVIARKRWLISAQNELPQGLFEAALLAKFYDNNSLFHLDFYFSKERDFIIAYWVRNLSKCSQNKFEDFLYDISNKSCHEVEIGALTWFLKQPANRTLLEIAARKIKSHSSSIRRVIFASILASFEYLPFIKEDWIISVIEIGSDDPDTLVKVLSAQIVAYFLDDSLFPRLNVDDIDLESFLTNLFQINDEEYSLSLGNTGEIILDTVEKLHTEFDSLITDVLEKLMWHDILSIRMNAASAFGFVEPKFFLEKLTFTIGLHKVGRVRAKEYMGGIDLALSSFYEIYDSRMCRGYLDYLRDHPEEHVVEYEEMSKLCMPIISFYWEEECGKNLLELLNSIAPDENTYKEEHCKALYRKRQEQDGFFQLSFLLN
jgi:hypothetical protein